MNTAPSSVSSNTISMQDPAISPSNAQNLIRNNYHQIKITVFFKLYNGTHIPPNIIEKYSTISFIDYDNGAQLSGSGWTWSDKTNGYDIQYNGELENSFESKTAAHDERNTQRALDPDLAAFTMFLSTVDEESRDLGFKVVFDAKAAGYGSGSQTFNVWNNGDQQLQKPPHISICDPSPYDVQKDVVSRYVDTYPEYDGDDEDYNQENTFFLINRSSAYIKNVVFNIDPSLSEKDPPPAWPPMPNATVNPEWAEGSYVYNDTSTYLPTQEFYHFFIWPIGPQGNASLALPFDLTPTVTYNDVQPALCVTKMYNHNANTNYNNCGTYYNCHLRIFDQWGNNFTATIKIEYDDDIAVSMASGWVESGRVFPS